MNQEEYIKERMREFASNIDELSIGQIVLDSNNKECKIVNKTTNSVEVFMKKTNEKGVNCNQWFDMRNFNRNFKIK